MTHEIDFERRPRLAAGYRDGMAPLTQAGQLAAVLVQLPPTFDRTLHHRRLLASLFSMKRARGAPVVMPSYRPERK